MKTVERIERISNEQIEHYAEEYRSQNLHLTSAMTFDQYLTGRLGGWNYTQKPVKEMKQA